MFAGKVWEKRLINSHKKEKYNPCVLRLKSKHRGNDCHVAICGYQWRRFGLCCKFKSNSSKCDKCVNCYRRAIPKSRHDIDRRCARTKSHLKFPLQLHWLDRRWTMSPNICTAAALLSSGMCIFSTRFPSANSSIRSSSLHALHADFRLDSIRYVGLSQRVSARCARLVGHLHCGQYNSYDNSHLSP